LSGCNRFSDTGLSHVANLTQLRSLDLSKCHRITAKALAAISKLKHLECLDISSTRVDLPVVYAWLENVLMRDA
jgi:Leucine-rich repeat (LRR) protein